MDNSHFDEKSGVITASTAWGRWNQTVSEVVIEVDVERGTRGKEVAIEIKPNHISCFVRKQEIFKVIYIFLVTIEILTLYYVHCKSNFLDNIICDLYSRANHTTQFLKMSQHGQ